MHTVLHICMNTWSFTLCCDCFSGHVFHILPIKETSPGGLNGTVHITDGLFYRWTHKGVTLPAYWRYCWSIDTERLLRATLNQIKNMHHGLQSSSDRPGSSRMIRTLNTVAALPIMKYPPIHRLIFLLIKFYPILIFSFFYSNQNDYQVWSNSTVIKFLSPGVFTWEGN